jgi:hypothetical protein
VTVAIAPLELSGPRGRTGRTGWLLMAAALLLTGGAILFARGWHPLETTATTSPSAAASMSVPRSAEIEDTYGVRFSAAVLTAHGGMIELQFQVLDQDKAAAIHDTEFAPVVTAGGNLFDAPGLSGHGTHSKITPAAGSTGFTLLANEGGRLHPGDEVTIVVGESELSDVVLG